MEVYQRSRYAFPQGGAWREFALDGSEEPMAQLPASVTLITAWNPMSQEQPWGVNEAANARLLRDLVAQGMAWAPAWGGSLPGVEPGWREEGFALFGLSRGEAAGWGLRYAQRALVWLDAESSELLVCEDLESVSCGLRRFS